MKKDLVSFVKTRSNPKDRKQGIENKLWTFWAQKWLLFKVIQLILQKLCKITIWKHSIWKKIEKEGKKYIYKILQLKYNLKCESVLFIQQK